MTIKQFLTRKWFVLIGILGWFYYLLVTFIFYNYISMLMLAGLTGALPSLILSFRKRNKDHRKLTLRRRLIVTGFILGLITFAFFPNIPRMPSQIHRRLDRCNTLITPNNSKVIEFRESFVSEFSLSGEIGDEDKIRHVLDLLDYYTQREIKWTEDLVTRAMAGDLSTPEEAITLGKDDCRGQAVVMASVLIGLGYDAWVVEMAWHWWVKVFDSNGVEYKLNHDGSKNRTVQYPQTMMFNHKQIVILQNPLGIYNGLMISSPNFYNYLEMAGPALVLVGVLLGIGAALYSTVCMGDLRLVLKKNKAARRRLRKRLLYGILAFLGLIGLLVILYFTPAVNFIGLYLFVYTTTGIITLLNLEEINDKFNR